MHYRNGREAKNGDKVVQLEGGEVTALGELRSAVPGNDYCNGEIWIRQPGRADAHVIGACLCDCLHVDDLVALIVEKDLDKRPPGK